MPFRILVTDEIDPEGVAILTAVGEFQVDVVHTLPPKELLARIGTYDAIVGRSATRITAELLVAGTRLKVVGRAGVGVDNVDVDKATELGIAVINAPAGNTNAVAELFFGALIGLYRQIPRAAQSMIEGRWDRSSLIGNEIKGRTLGIVGLGRIGRKITRRASPFHLDVVGYDPYITEERFTALRVRRATSLNELLEQADVVTIHTPLNDETRGMIGADQLRRMKAGAVLVNLARGGIVDDAALLAALESGHLRGAILDVYDTEPLPADHPLRRAKNVVLTPHMGASTHEAQHNVAIDVAEAVRDALVAGELSRSLNVVSIPREAWMQLRPSMEIAERAARVARALLASRGHREVRRVALRCGPAVIAGSEALLSSAVIGVLRGVVENDRLNVVSARAIAELRGLELSVKEVETLEHPATVEVSLSAGNEELAVQGVATAGAPGRLTKIAGFHVDVAPRKTLIVLTNRDVPGVIGHVGTALGEARINIASYHQSRMAQGGQALAAISVDDPVSAHACRRLLELPDVLSATVISFD
ncbi:MAG: phosphoglycerate dehydrogenase [Gemmatimonadaceae bacterium]